MYFQWRSWNAKQQNVDLRRCGDNRDASWVGTWMFVVMLRLPGFFARHILPGCRLPAPEGLFGDVRIHACMRVHNKKKCLTLALADFHACMLSFGPVGIKGACGSEWVV